MGSEVEKSWLAGFLDGEGCFALRKNGTNHYQVNIFLSNTARIALDRVQYWYAGSIYEYKNVPKGQKRQYRWECPTDSHVVFLEDVIPYLFLKKPQALLVLEFTKNKKNFLRIKRHMSQEELDYRESIYLKVRILNRKGDDGNSS